MDSKDQTTTTTQNTQPWQEAIPQLKDIMSKAGSLFGSSNATLQGRDVTPSYNQGMGALKQTAQAVEQARTEMMTAIAQQGAQTQAMVMEILNAIRAPRVRVPVRGKDGRISQVIDRPQDEGEGTVQ